MSATKNHGTLLTPPGLVSEIANMWRPRPSASCERDSAHPSSAAGKAPAEGAERVCTHPLAGCMSHVGLISHVCLSRGACCWDALPTRALAISGRDVARCWPDDRPFRIHNDNNIMLLLLSGDEGLYSGYSNGTPCTKFKCWLLRKRGGLMCNSPLWWSASCLRVCGRLSGPPAASGWMNGL